MTERALLPGEYAVLGLLALQPMHGYEMATVMVAEGLDAVCPVDPSTLYTYLRNVEMRALVSWTEERSGGRPPRKIYDLTPAGRSLVETWLRAPVERMRDVRVEFLLKLFFLERLDPAGQRRLVAGQLDACRSYLAALDEPGATTPFRRLVLESKRSAAEATLSWLRAYAREVEVAG